MSAVDSRNAEDALKFMIASLKQNPDGYRGQSKFRHLYAERG